MILRFLLTFVLLSTSLFCEIVETNDIKTVLPYVKQDSLVLFNTSDVLYEHTSFLAEAQFREYLQESADLLIKDDQARSQFINKVRGLLVTRLPKKNVDQIIPRLIKNLQNQKISVLGITEKRISTPYSENYALLTSESLLSLGIDLKQTLSYQPFIDRQGTDDYFFIYGIIFTQKKPVGVALTAFLEKNRTSPKQVIMVDNSWSSLESAEKALKEKGIDFQGIRYGAGDQRKAKFDLDLAIIEFFALINGDQVMPDDQALKIKLNNPTIDYKMRLDQFITESTRQ